MVSVSPEPNVESRHFFNGERQITIGIETWRWDFLQEIANNEAKKKGWLLGYGSDRDYLNIWIIGRIASCPKGVEPYQWISSYPMVEEVLDIIIEEVFDENYESPSDPLEGLSQDQKDDIQQAMQKLKELFEEEFKES